MGKNLNNGDLVQRAEKLAFYGVPTTSGGSTTITYTRMEGFTSLSGSKNPSEYSRRYVDETSDRVSISGYAPAIAYEFDRYKGNAVLDDIIDIHEHEKIGGQASRTIIQVDLTTAQEGTGGAITATAITATAIKRDYSVIPDSDGGSNDALTYSGNFRAAGAPETVTVSTSDDWQTVTIVE